MLAVASVLAEDMRCPGCGQVKAESYNPDSAGWYELREAECQGCAELARAADADKRSRPDVHRWVVDARPADVELRPWQPGPLTAQQLPHS